LYSPGDGLIAAAKDVLGALRLKNLIARRITVDGGEAVIAPGYWNNKSVRDDPDYTNPAIVIAAAEVRKLLQGNGSARPKKPPRLPEAKLKWWWDALSDDERAKGHEELWTLCRDAHPGHSISRERVRALDPGRKRGPKSRV
jgi:hypothetical protein